MCHYNEVEWETFNEHLYAGEGEAADADQEETLTPEEEPDPDPGRVASHD